MVILKDNSSISFAPGKIKSNIFEAIFGRFIKISLLKSVLPCKNTFNNFEDPANGGAIAMNFFIFFKKALSSLFLNKFVKVSNVPYE